MGFHKYLQNSFITQSSIFSQSIFEHFHALFCISFFHLFGHPSLVLIESPTSFPLKRKMPSGDHQRQHGTVQNHGEPHPSQNLIR